MTKALSLTQPWATLVVIGAKRYETRSWFTGYRGPLVIHASKGFPPDCRALCRTEPFKKCLTLGGYESPDDLPIGAIVGRTWMTDCISTAYVFDDPKIGPYEKEFGDFGLGRYAWRLSKPERLATPPIPCAGKLGLWNVSEELEAMMKEAQWLFAQR